MSWLAGAAFKVPVQVLQVWSTYQSPLHTEAKVTLNAFATAVRKRPIPVPKSQRVYWQVLTSECTSAVQKLPVPVLNVLVLRSGNCDNEPTMNDVFWVRPGSSTAVRLSSKAGRDRLLILSERT